MNRFDESIDETLRALALDKSGDNDDINVNTECAKELIGQSIAKYIELDLKTKNYLTDEDGYNLMKWLYDNGLYILIKCSQL